jgi:Tol biopolymer transport system component
MRSQHCITPLLLCLASFLTLLCVIAIGLVIIVGNAIPSQIISFTPPEIVNAEQKYLVYVMDIHAGFVTNLSHQLVARCCPVWSSDGDQIAFADLNGKFFILEAWADVIYPLNTPPNFNGGDMLWSPDNKSILGKDFDNNGLYRINLDGSNPNRLTFFNDAVIYVMDWSPDSHFIVFDVAGQEDREIYRINIGDNNVRQLTDTIDENIMPSISPDNEHIVFVSNRDNNMELYTLNMNTGEEQPLTQTDEEDEVWSPDGKYILFLTYPKNNSLWGLNIMNVDGDERRLLTNFYGLNGIPSWSPDGTHILYEVLSTYDWNALYVMDVDTHNIKRLIETQQPRSLHSAWQP